MALVGIIANPAASKDIRRLVAQGRVVADWEKVNIIQRVLLGLEAAGIQRVAAMPDSSHLVERARDDPQLSLDLEMIKMPTFYGEGDTIRASAMMGDMGVDCLVTLGGDGTNRAVARGCCSIPLVPISTGTNNVFPAMREATIAGLAAGLVATGQVPVAEGSVRNKVLRVDINGVQSDLALVDLCTSTALWIGSRALWKADGLDQLFRVHHQGPLGGQFRFLARLRVERPQFLQRMGDIVPVAARRFHVGLGLAAHFHRVPPPGIPGSGFF